MSKKTLHHPKSPQDWITRVVDSESFTVGTYQDATAGEPGRLPLALPVPPQSDTHWAVLQMSLELQALADILNDTPLPEGAAMTIIDQSGTILARNPPDSKAVGSQAPDADSFLPGFLTKGQNVWEAVGIDGVQRIYSLVPMLHVGDHAFYLRVGMPTAVAFAAAKSELLRNLSYLGAMTALALFSTWLFSNAFVLRQIKQLYLATRRLADGDYGHRIGDRGSGVLGELAQAFDSMAGVVESKTIQLVAAELKYRNIYEHAVSGIFQTTPDGRLVSANTALARYFGYNTADELLATVTDIGSQIYADPGTRRVVQNILEREGSIVGHEFPAKRADGGRLWLSLNARTVRRADGSVALYEGTLIDITERKKVEDDLRNKQEQLQALLDHSPAMITIKDAEGRYILANRMHRKLHGYQDNPIGKAHVDLYAPEFARRLATEDRLVLDTGQAVIFQRPLTVNNVHRHFMVVKSPLFDSSGRPDRVCSIAYDITEFEQVREELRQSQELLARTQRVGQIGGWRIDLRTRERKGTEEFFRLLGLSEDAMPDLEDAPRLVAPEDQEQCHAVLRAAVELGEPFDVELRLARKEDGQRWVRFMGKREDRGDSRILVGTVQDITDRKNLELLREDIENIIRHDLKTPLNYIINLPQLIIGEAPLMDKQVEYLRDIEQSGRKMLRHIEMSLEVMKMERGQFTLHPCVVDLLATVRGVVGEITEAAQLNQLTIELRLDGEPVNDQSAFMVRGEERLCYPIVANLVANAVEASPPGETIVISFHSGQEQRIGIRNRGSVPVEIRDRFFDKFVTSGKFKGTGLGTYSARLFTVAQGGSIALDSSEEGATTVIVCLPGIAPAEPRPAFA